MTNHIKMTSEFRYALGISLVFLAVSIAFKLSMLAFNAAIDSHYLVVLIPILLAATLGVKTKTTDFPKPLKIILWANIILITGYASISYITVLPETSSEETGKLIIETVRFLAIVCGIAALWRPSLAFVTFMYLPWRDSMLSKLTAVPPGDRIDWVVCSEMGMFILMAYFGLKIAIKYLGEEKIYGKERADKISTLSPINTIFIAALCIHFANYFFSGFQKLILRGGPETWVLENPTYEHISFAAAKGLFPMSLLSPESIHSIYQLAAAINIPLNLSVFLIQFVAIFAFSKIRLAILITLFYDAMHIMIFLFSGIFFWKWIFLNLAIVAALSSFKMRTLPRPFFWASVGFIGLSPLFYSVAFLGWYDTHAAKVTKIYAHMEDTKRLEVPNNYFLIHSFRPIFSFDNSLEGGFEKMWALGTAGEGSYEILQQSKDCSIPTNNKAIDENHPRKGLKSAETLLKRHHRYILSTVNSEGKLNYDLYPHHIWANPWGFNEFKNADKRKIIGYELETTSQCFKFKEDGTPIPEVRFIVNHYVPIK